MANYRKNRPQDFSNDMNRLRERSDFQQDPDGTRFVGNFTAPPQQSFDSPELEGSTQQILSENIGKYVVIEFLIGTERITRKQGMIYLVGTSFITLYDDVEDVFILCDIFSVKFVYFLFPGERPRFNYNRLPAPGAAGTGRSS